MRRLTFRKFRRVSKTAAAAASDWTWGGQVVQVVAAEDDQDGRHDQAGEGLAESRAGKGPSAPVCQQHAARADRHDDHGKPVPDRVQQTGAVADLLQLVGLEEHQLPVDLGGLGGGGHTGVHERLLDLVDGFADVESDRPAVHADGATSLAGERVHDRGVGGPVGVRPDPLEAVALHEARGHLLDRVVDRGVELRAQPLQGLRSAWRQSLGLPPRGDVRGDLGAVHPDVGGFGDALDRRVLDRRIRGQRRDRRHIPVRVQHDVVHPDREQCDRHQDAGEHDEHGRADVPGDPRGCRTALVPAPRLGTRVPLRGCAGFGRLVRAGHGATGILGDWLALISTDARQDGTPGWAARAGHGHSPAVVLLRRCEG